MTQDVGRFTLGLFGSVDGPTATWQNPSSVVFGWGVFVLYNEIVENASPLRRVVCYEMCSEHKVITVRLECGHMFELIRRPVEKFYRCDECRTE